MAQGAEPPVEGGDRLDEMPTLPPTPQARPDGLRWATRVPPPSPPPRRKVAPKAGPLRKAAPTPGPPQGPLSPTEPSSRQASPTLPLPRVVAPPAPAGGRAKLPGPGAPPPPSQPRRAHRPMGPLRPGQARSPRQRPHRWLLALAVALIAAGAAVFVALGTSAERSAGALAPAKTFESLLRQLAGADARASKAANAACLGRAPGSAERQRALASLRGSEAAGREVLSVLSAERARLLAWPPGRALYGDLAGVTRLFLAKGADLEAWVSGLQATGCYSAPTNNLFHVRAVQVASAQRAAARLLLVAWAGPARRYHLQTFGSI